MAVEEHWSYLLFPTFLSITSDHIPFPNTSAISLPRLVALGDDVCGLHGAALEAAHAVEARGLGSAAVVCQPSNWWWEEVDTCQAGPSGCKRTCGIVVTVARANRNVMSVPTDQNEQATHSGSRLMAAALPSAGSFGTQGSVT